MQISFESLEEGMRFSKDVFFDDGRCLLLAAGNPIGERELRALRQWKIPYVVTDGKILCDGEDASLDALESLEEEFGEIEDITNTIYIEGSQLSNENIMLVSKMVVFDLPQELINTSFYREYHNILQEFTNVFLSIKENKPVNSELFFKYSNVIFNMVRENLQEVVIIVLASDAKVDEFSQKVVNSALLTALLCNFMNFSENDAISVILASLLCKVGVLRLPAVLPNDMCSLTEVEIQVLTTQISYAYRYAVQELGCSESIGFSIQQQYEYWNGKGYPDGLIGENIRLGARIISVVNEFIGVLGEHEQKKPIMSYEAIKHLLSDNSNKFDPNIVKTIVQCLGVYPIGSIVLLNDGAICKVIKNTADAPLRPCVQVILSEKGKIVAEDQNVIIDLKIEKEKIIVRAVDPRVYLQ